ncbi:hypothetical protein [Hyphococcus sp. DH-69]
MPILAFETFSLVEWVIMGFIGTNMAVAGLYVIERSVKHLDNRKK